MMKKLIALGTAAAFAGLSGMALAEDDRKGRKWRGNHGFDRHMLRMLDTNMDREVTLDEFTQLNAKRFEAVDTNGDGSLNDAEIEAIVADRATALKDRMMERLDADGDGLISAREFDGPSERRFARLDRNDDGKLTRDDMRGRGKYGRTGKRRHHHGGDALGAEVE